MQELKKQVNLRLQEQYPDFMDMLQSIGAGKTLLRVPRGHTIFSEGERADAIYFIQSGKVKISAVAADGKEAVFAVLGNPAFFGETCLVGQSRWVSTATAAEESEIWRIEKDAMLKILHNRPDLCARFSAGLLVRIIRLEEDVRAQFFYDNAKKLARVLLRLAQLDQHRGPVDVTLPRWSHDSLGKMMNASRSHVTRLMNQFRKTGLIDYDRSLTVKTKRLLNVLLHD